MQKLIFWLMVLLEQLDGTIDGIINAVNATKSALKNCAPFIKCNLEINDKKI